MALALALALALPLTLTYVQNGWNGQFHVYNLDDPSVNFTIDSGHVHTEESPLLTSKTMFEFRGTSPDGRVYPSYQLMFSLVDNGNSSLEIIWSGGDPRIDTIPFSGPSAVLLTIDSIMTGLLGVILDDGKIGGKEMTWENYGANINSSNSTDSTNSTGSSSSTTTSTTTTTTATNSSITIDDNNNNNNTNTNNININITFDVKECISNWSGRCIQDPITSVTSCL
ncbi:hypothetical protein RHMOL_Rhmol10G0053700 [Rhododendron molle]|uniref:Uncharacterized protein n=1 Tax=Rhododendron molle TaxID=49168 RepID=A0ACC0LZP6_RHOML|nr:hypothetical protein RHMOL_Rhmol10G0053700 [Rhododendron molle]